MKKIVLPLCTGTVHGGFGDACLAVHISDNGRYAIINKACIEDDGNELALNLNSTHNQEMIRGAVVQGDGYNSHDNPLFEWEVAEYKQVLLEMECI